MFSNMFSGFKRGRSGFFIDGKFYDNKGLGHTANARAIIEMKGWTKKAKGKDEQDFLVFEKGAVQIGSSVNQKIVLVARKHFNERKLERFKKDHDIEDYQDCIMNN